MKGKRIDYHVHPDYSIDAVPASIRDFCLRCLELKLEEICFTTHLEFNPGMDRINNTVLFRGREHPAKELSWLDGYLGEIEEARSEFKRHGLVVKAGIEIGYEPELEEDIEKVVREYPFEFILGAIHCINGISISSMMESSLYFSNRSLRQVRDEYFHALQAAVRTGLFHCVAHVDLYRRYGMKRYGPEILDIHHGFIEPIFRDMACRGIGLEINSSGLRKGLGSVHPSREILSLAVEAGITNFTVGSDAHSLDELGCGIDEALALLEQFGLQAWQD